MKTQIEIVFYLKLYFEINGIIIYKEFVIKCINEYTSFVVIVVLEMRV